MLCRYIIIKCWEITYDGDLSERGIPFKQRLDAFWKAVPVFFVPVSSSSASIRNCHSTESAASYSLRVIIAFARKE